MKDNDLNLKIGKEKFELTACQKLAMEALNSNENVFLTGHAGTGKSFVINQFQKSLKYPLPVLASTGAAAVLVEGRTFHAYFGLGIMEGGIDRTVKKAVGNKRLRERIKKNHTIIIDEISMIHPEAFEAANRIAQVVNDTEAPFGGIRLIVVGDFLQLPPISKFNDRPEWLFDMNVWHELIFEKIYLTETMRTGKKNFINVLNSIREGLVTEEVSDFLDSRVSKVDDNFDGTVLFGRRNQAEAFNIKKLSQLTTSEVVYETHVKKSSKVNKTTDSLLGLSPLPKELKLKKNALVMLRKNDPDNRYVNGSLAWVKKLLKEEIEVQLFSGEKIRLTKEEFHILDADGQKVATIRNFPLSLAWATTIHKAQGASIDRIHIDLSNLWECGQAYVALSRARSPENLFIESWSKRSIKADPDAVDFYRNI